MSGIDWRDLLIDENRDIFLREFGGRTYAPGRPAVGDGWRELIETAVRRIRCAVRGSDLFVSQIKSRYGSVRISWETVEPLPAGTAAAIEHAVALAKARSLCTCEVCGAIGTSWRRGELLGTACDEHGAGVQVPAPSWFENLHVVLEFKGGRPAAIRCRRYDRNGDFFSMPTLLWRAVVDQSSTRLRTAPTCIARIPESDRHGALPAPPVETEKKS
jgi:hypothetical protein